MELYGLAPTAVLPVGMPRSIRTGQPPDPVPCFLLGQLATDRAWAGKGIAIGLLKHALARCVAAAGLVGGRAVVVKAIGAEAAELWRRRGFVPSRDDPLVLSILAHIAASLSAASRRKRLGFVPNPSEYLLEPGRRARLPALFFPALIRRSWNQPG